MLLLRPTKPEFGFLFGCISAAATQRFLWLRPSNRVGHWGGWSWRNHLPFWNTVWVQLLHVSLDHGIRLPLEHCGVKVWQTDITHGTGAIWICAYSLPERFFLDDRLCSSLCIVWGLRLGEEIRAAVWHGSFPGWLGHWRVFDWRDIRIVVGLSFSGSYPCRRLRLGGRPGQCQRGESFQ